MYSPSQLAFKYLKYYLTSSNGKGHGTHSPFVFQFITKVMNDKTAYPEYKKVEALRKQLRSDAGVLTIEDFGAGSVKGSHHQRTVSSIAKNAAKPARFGQLLYRMVKNYQPATILELGTSLGITTAYLTLGQPQATIITMEGAAAVAARASRHFSELQLQPVRQVLGNFDETLPALLQEWQPGTGKAADFVFIDGNHRQEPTERYFQQLLPFINNDSILIFDDIHWSAEMERAWATIQSHPSVRCTIDLFFIGIVFFRKEFTEKQHFTIRF
ncbi:MAG: class I SAM-dependent methyltransferase [Bacteroidetes bacterium]|nr:class I SAM-dependent methyltransferase [Bacteroidota bacterium]